MNASNPAPSAVRAAWDAAWREAMGDGFPAEFEDLWTRYGEAHRRYHDRAHVAAMFDFLRPYRDELRDATAVTFAVFYHDAIYDPCSKVNEKESAHYAGTCMHGMNVPLVQRRRVEALIELTQTHPLDQPDVDARIFLDADLAILGSDAEAYDAYARAIREEYAHVADEAYRAGRRAVLEKFLAAPRLYRHAPVRAQLEASARANLRRELMTLGV